MKNLHISLSLLVLVGLSWSSFGQQGDGVPEKAGTVPTAIPAEGTPVQLLETAYRLYEFGVANNSVPSLVASAEILQTVPTRNGAQKGVLVSLDGTASNPEEGAGEESPRLTPAAVLDTAEDVAGEDEGLLALVAQQRAAAAAVTGTLGARDGPVEYGDCLPVKYYYKYEIAFNAQEYAEIAVMGDDRSDLDLFVYDEMGELLGQSDDYSSSCYVRVLVSEAQSLSIRIVNRGDRSSCFVLVTN